MAETLFINKPFVSANLTSGTDTLNYTVPSGGAGIYTVKVDLTEVPVSGISIVVKQGASTRFTAPTISPTQIGQKFKFTYLYADADVIGVVISSSTAIDKVANNVKAIVTIQQGL